MSLLIYNIQELLQTRLHTDGPISGVEMDTLPTIQDSFVLIEHGRITAYGSMRECPDVSTHHKIDATGRIVMPTWCDSHTHIVYAGNRESEFVDRIKGLSYEEIAAKGGGIINSAQLLQQISDEELYQQSRRRLDEVMSLGTGAIEIKSGYGLTPEAEIRMLRVIKQLKQSYDLPIKATFLAAHAVPLEYRGRQEAYIKTILSECLPTIDREGLADYIDVFCEQHYFSVAEMEAILKEGKRYGLRPKVHVNQFNSIGGVTAAVTNDALTIDHLEVLTEADLEALANSRSIPVALPTCSYFLDIPYTPARAIIDSGLPLAVASDYNPGSTPSGNMNLVLSMCCIKLRMTPAEAINAATINGAYAMGLQAEVGSITEGKLANLIITKPINSYAYLPYAFGSNHIDQVIIKGELLNPSTNTGNA